MNKIIDANGTQYVGITYRRRRMVRIGGIIAGVIALPFFAAACAGVAEGIAHPAATTIHTINICAGLTATQEKYCNRLAARKATTRDYQGAKVDSPAGAVMVKECKEQYKGQELTDCLHYSN